MNDIVPNSGRNLQPLIEAVLARRSDLSNAPISVPLQGYNGQTVFIGGEVFKSPIRMEEAQAFEKEFDIQAHLQGKTRVPVPAITYRDREAHIVGIEKLPGEQATYELIAGLTPQQRNNFAEDFAGFTNDVRRAFKLEDIQALGLTRIAHMDRPPPLAQTLADSHVQAFLGPELMEKARIVERNYAALAPLSDEDVVIHADPTFGNLLIDRTTGHLTGVLDFGEAGVSSIENNFAALIVPKDCLRRTLTSYADDGGCAMNVDDIMTLRHANMFGFLGHMLKHEKFKPFVDFRLATLKREMPEIVDLTSSPKSRARTISGADLERTYRAHLVGIEEVNPVEGASSGAIGRADIKPQSPSRDLEHT